jgi:hypothetical protein
MSERGFWMGGFGYVDVGHFFLLDRLLWLGDLLSLAK